MYLHKLTQRICSKDFHKYLLEPWEIVDASRRGPALGDKPPKTALLGLFVLTALEATVLS